MKIKNKILISVDSSDIVDGKFTNKEVTEVVDNCFFNLSDLRAVSLPKVTKIGNDCFRYNAALTTVTLPALTTAGNDCFRYNDKLTTVTLPALTTAGNYCFSSNDKLTTVTLRKTGYGVKCIDGSCFVIKTTHSSKGIKIYSGYNFLGMQKRKVLEDECFVAEKENFFAHGKTIKKAVGDVQFKIVAEKLKKDPITKDTMFSVKYYRLITGSCDHGVRSWMKANNIPFNILNEGMPTEETVEKEKIKAVDLLPILEKTRAYGVEKFKQLVTF